MNLMLRDPSLTYASYTSILKKKKKILLTNVFGTLIKKRNVGHVFGFGASLETRNYSPFKLKVIFRCWSI